MPFPNHPDKHDAPPLLTPEASVRYFLDSDPADVPRDVILWYDGRTFEALA